MAITPANLTAAVYATHIAQYPDSVTASRSNPATGVAPHNPSYELISGLCSAVSVVAKQLTWLDVSSGTADVPGTPVPANFTFPGRQAAITQFLATTGWAGREASRIANILIGGPLDQLAAQGLLTMQSHLVVGTGTGIVSAANNTGLVATATSLLETQLPAALQATGVFGLNDVPANPINPVLAALLPAYASAYASALATLTATVTYVGVTGNPAAAAGTNPGSIA